MTSANSRVLFIEDDIIDQLAFRRLVHERKLPYSYTIAGSVAEARKILSEEDFDVVISDYSLGDGTAFEAIDFHKKAPVIMITGVGNEDIAVTAMKKGAYDYLTKDLDRNYLTILPVVIEKTISRKKMEDEKEQLLIDLQNALSQVKRLSGMLPICSSCKKIRDDKGYWRQVADYISEHSEVEFTHGMCPECLEVFYGKYLNKDQEHT